MDGRPIWTDCDEAGNYVVPNVLSPRDLVFRPDNMDETVPHTTLHYESTPSMQYTAIFKGCKSDNFQMTCCVIFLVLLKTLIVGTR